MILNHDTLNEMEYPESVISIDGTTLNNVKNFKYLGCYVDCFDPNTGDF